jgi:hypothetical protein
MKTAGQTRRFHTKYAAALFCSLRHLSVILFDHFFERYAG